MWNGKCVYICNKKAVFKETGTIVGSVMNLMDCLKSAVEMGIPLETAVACATIQPAEALHVDREYGSISVGKKANLVLLDKELQIKHVIKDGMLLR